MGGSVLIFLIVLVVGFFLAASLTRHQSAATRSHEVGSTTFPSRSPGDHGRLNLARQRERNVEPGDRAAQMLARADQVIE